MIEEAELSEHKGYSEETCLNHTSLINCSNLTLARRIRYDKRANRTGNFVSLGEYPTLSHIHNVNTSRDCGLDSPGCSEEISKAPSADQYLNDSTIDLFQFAAIGYGDLKD